MAERANRDQCRPDLRKLDLGATGHRVILLLSVTLNSQELFVVPLTVSSELNGRTLPGPALSLNGSSMGGIIILCGGLVTPANRRSAVNR
jgi:hypothetical protein